MNTALAIAIASIAALGTTAATIPALTATHADTTCQDLAGQGQACITQDGDCTTGSCSVSVCVTSPAACDDGSGQGPALGATRADTTCQDLAGQGQACITQDGDCTTGSCSVSVCVTSPAACDDGSGQGPATREMAPTCQDLAGNGSACVDGDQSAGSVDVNVDNQQLGLHSSTHAGYTTGL